MKTTKIFFVIGCALLFFTDLNVYDLAKLQTE